MGLTRSENMRRIRGRHTKPERILCSALWAAGLRYRLHARTPAGRPDIVFPGPKVAVFVDGCFWHGCPEHYVRPRSRRDFWAAKLAGNVERDRRQTRELEGQGWRVVRLWEHRVLADLERVVGQVVAVVQGNVVPAAPLWRVEHAEPLPDADDLERWTLVTLRGPAERRKLVRKRTTGKW